MKSDTKLFLLSILGLFLPCLFYLGPSPVQGPKYRLVIATISRISNAEHRNVVRNTWKRYLPASVLFKFVLGDAGCPIDALWRIRPDVCAPWQLQLPGWVQDGTPLIPYNQQLRQDRPTFPPTKQQPLSTTILEPIYEGITFHVKAFPIVVHRLGIWRPLLDSLGPNETVSVGLRNRRTDELLFHVNFGYADRTILPSVSDGSEAGYAFHKLSQKSGRAADLPAGFEGSLQLRMRIAANGSRSGQLRLAKLTASECAVKFQYQLGNPGIFVITGLKSAGQPRAVPFREDSCPLVNIEYSLMDVFDVRQHLGARETHNIVEERRVKEEEKSLFEEVEDHDDLFFIHNYDTPSDLPLNIKVFLSSIVNTVDFDYILFTSDQSFIHITNILAKLDTLTDNSWWGRFRFFQLVDAPTDGPYWPDLHYAALSYPPLPASRSFVLSRQLAAFLAANSELLSSHQSLASSLAVWLAATSPTLLEDSNWMDGNAVASLGELEVGGSENGLLAVDNLSVRDMEELWRVM